VAIVAVRLDSIAEELTIMIQVRSHSIFSSHHLTLVAGFGLLASVVALPQVAGADADLEKGKAVYNGAGACMSCHGALGAGDGAAATALPVKPRNFAKGEFGYDTDGDGKKGTETDIFNIVTNGAVKFGGSPMMAGRPDLPEADRKALAKYVISLGPKK
jgi:mono/diheme cytochrome c family protein